MKLEGKILGYNKKMVVIVGLAIILAGVFFYAGAKYEKNKLISLKLMKNNAKDVCTPAPSKKDKTEQTAVPAAGTTATSTDTTNTTTPKAANTTTTTNTTK